MDAWLCREGFEEAVARELKLAGARVVAGVPPGLVAAELLPGVARPDPAFASQSLPDARRIAGASVAKLAHSVFEEVGAGLDAAAAWTLHAVAPEIERPERLEGRARLVGRELAEIVKDKLRRAAKRLVRPEALSGEGSVLQIVLARADEAWVSLAAIAPLASGFREPSPWPLGRAPVEENREAPSSAYRKVEEAYALLGAAPRAGERVVDLGAAPGGWSWTALARGARVTAIDRARLLPPVAGHANLTHLERDATTWDAPEPFDWLLCDAIMEPAKTLALLDRWLERGWCRRFVVNVKFKGDDYGAVPKLRALLARRGITRARVKQLGADKNEVTCLGETP